MTFTIGLVAGWDAAALAACAAGLRQAAAELAALASRLGQVVPPAAGWTGPSADAAERRAQRTHRTLDDVAAAIEASADAVSTASDRLGVAVEQLSRSRRLARSVGRELTETGGAAAVAPPDFSCLLGAALDAALARRQEDDRLAALASAMAVEALAAAETADRLAARSLTEAAAAAHRLAPAARWWLDSWATSLSGAPLRAIVAAGLLRTGDQVVPPAAGTPPAAVAAWWAVLTPAEQDKAVRADPAALGRLDGLPGAVRHRANMTTLHAERDAVQSELDRFPRYARAGELRARLRTLDAVASVIDADPARRRLLDLDIDAALAAVAVGDVDTADHVAIVVPGLAADVPGDLDSLTHDADRLATTAGAWLARLAPAETVATVAWLGYDTPSVVTVASAGEAKHGARALRSALRGLDAARSVTRAGGGGRELHLTVVGHSYGSLATGIALREPTGADEAVLIGSPGVGTEVAADLSVPVGHVYVGEAADDVVADLAWFTRDPSEPGFGAVPLSTAAGPDPITGEPLAAADGHSDYFDTGGAAVRDMALVAIGQSHRLGAQR